MRKLTTKFTLYLYHGSLFRSVFYIYVYERSDTHKFKILLPRMCVLYFGKKCYHFLTYLVRSFIVKLSSRRYTRNVKSNMVFCVLRYLRMYSINTMLYNTRLLHLKKRQLLICMCLVR